MKKYFLSILLLALMTECFGQVDSITPPFQRFPTFPPVKLLNVDSISFFSKEDLPKKKPVMLMIFNPTCDHCKHETQEIIDHIEEFKKIHIVMATTMPYDSMMSFRKRFGLEQYKNITVAQDNKYFLPVFYKISNLPFIALYDKKGKLVSTYEGTVKAETLLEALK